MQNLSREKVTENSDELRLLLTEEGIEPKSAEQEPQPPKFEKLILPRELSEGIPDFPEDSFEDPVRNMIEAVTQSVQVDNPMTGTFALGFASAMVGKAFRVRAWGGREEPLNLFTMITADSGERKSSVMSYFTRPIVELVDQWNKDHEIEAAMWRSRVNILKRQKDSLEKRLSATDNDQEKELELTDKLRAVLDELTDKLDNPRLPVRIFAQDCTPEKIVDLLAKNNSTLAIASDEGGVLSVLTGNRYSADGKQDNIDTLLQSYSGSNISVSRVGRKSDTGEDTTEARDACLTLIIALQRVTLESMVSKNTLAQRGLTARFLFCLPQSKVGKRKAKTEAPPDFVLSDYRSFVQRLLDARLTRRYEEPEVIELSPDAAAAHAAIEDRNEDRLGRMKAERKETSAFFYWLSRGPGHCLRIAGLLHVMKHGTEAGDVPLSRDTYQKAERLYEYYKVCAERVFSINGGADCGLFGTSLALYNVLEGLYKKGITKTTARDLLRKCRMMRTMKEMEPVLADLEQRGFVSVEETDGPHRHSQTVYINPEAFPHIPQTQKPTPQDKNE